MADVPECCKGCSFHRSEVEKKRIVNSFIKSDCMNPFVAEEWCLDENRPELKGVYHSDNMKRIEKANAKEPF